MDVTKQRYDAAKLEELAFKCPMGCDAKVECCPDCNWLKIGCDCGFFEVKCRCESEPGQADAELLLEDLVSFVAARNGG